MKKRISWFAIVLMIFVAVAAGREQRLSGEEPHYVISPGDLLQIKVFRTPDLDTQARVDSEGLITMPLIGAIHVAGLDTNHAAKEIEEQLTKANLIRNLPVTVFVSENATQKASVIGEVKTPGQVPLAGEVRLLDVLATAGGLLPTASGVISIAHKDRPKEVEEVHIHGTLAGIENPTIMPGDTLLAEKAGIVYVVGGVNKPGGFVLQDGKAVTLLQALALAEGNLSTASLSKSLLIRTVNGQRQAIPVNLKALLRNHGDDQRLQDNDILFIPDSATKEIMKSGIQGVIEIATGVSIYRL
jgi:polysaccharide export outer membrane protein